MKAVALVEHHGLRRHDVLGHAEAVRGRDQISEHAVELVDRAPHGVLEALAAVHAIGEVDRDQLGIAVRHEAVSVALELAPLAPVVGQLAVVHDRDVAERIGPIGVRRTDVDIGFGRHPRVADGVRALEVRKRILAADGSGVAQILDQLERLADREDLGALDILDVVDQPPELALVAEEVAKRVLGRLVPLQHLRAHLLEPVIDPASPLADLMVDVKPLPAVLLLGDLEAHDVGLGVVVSLPVEGKAGRVRTAMPERLQHRGHLLADRALLAAIDQPCNSAHSFVLPFAYGRQSR